MRSSEIEDAPWTCQLFVRIEANEKGEDVQATMTTFGPLLTEPSAVTDMTRRAQLAALSPDKTVESFVTCDIASTKATLEFSRNVVVLEITGPGVTDVRDPRLTALTVTAHDHRLAGMCGRWRPL